MFVYFWVIDLHSADQSLILRCYHVATISCENVLRSWSTNACHRELIEVQDVRFIKPLRITDVRGGYHFGLWCPGRGGRFGCPGMSEGRGVSFSISSVGEVRILSGMTQCHRMPQWHKMPQCHRMPTSQWHKMPQSPKMPQNATVAQWWAKFIGCGQSS